MEKLKGCGERLNENGNADVHNNSLFGNLMINGR